jgi:hypothetical protein
MSVAAVNVFVQVQFLEFELQLRELECECQFAPMHQLPHKPCHLAKNNITNKERW